MSASLLHPLVRWLKRPYWDAPDPSWVVRRWPDLTACCVAALFFWLSLTPSLLPRPWYLQGLVGGITAAIGYALGAAASSLFRALCRRRPGERARARCWLAFHVLGIALSTAAVSWSAHAQRRLRRLQEVEPSLVWHTPMIILIAVAVCALLVLLARCVRLVARRLTRFFGRWVPRPAAYVIGVALTALLVTIGSKDVLYERGFIDIVDRISKVANLSTADGITQPASPYVSGGPTSVVDWAELGAEGRNFIGSVPRKQDIAAFTGRPAKDPVRVYIGEQEGGDAHFRRTADLAVQELERTGGFDRKVLALLGTTGSGWVDPRMPEPLEYMYGGDSAIVATQYSYLPSWISFLVDKEKAARDARAVFDAVYAKWSALPADDRPKLVVGGESLGTYATEAAFDGLDDMLGKVDGALLAGPPNVSPVWKEVTTGRDPGSPVWRPEYDRGRHVRFAQYPERDLKRPAGPWEHPRVVYLQNASDPVVWWTPDLLWHRPAWLNRPLGPDVTDEMRFWPVITFWQTTVDLAVSFGAPPPHGHRYGTGAVDGWAAIVPPPGWTGQDTARLRAYEGAKEAPY
ncbi:hypothetical protein ADL21_15215 [Streptomyces albus subsp. albus]|nr:hypothetical protein ADL21_15215 [Streptomyces albus subsp. albus]